MKNNKQTTLDLNGPILSFDTQPVGIATTNGGSATFTGIATATFPNVATNTGSIAYQWYDQNGAISNGTYITGAATSTLTLSNLISPTDHKRQVYVIADYIPSAYGQGPITAGTARSTGNAINEPISSNVGILTVFPVLSITTQPIGAVFVENVNEVFNVVATSSDISQGTLSYQWSLNEIDLTDNSSTSGATTPNLTISRPVGVNSMQVRVSNSLASNSPLYSDVIYLYVIANRKMINIEQYDTTSTTAILSSNDLLVQELTLLGENQTSATSLISLYASELNINVEMDIYSGSGLNGESGLNGGQGGYSRIRFTMKKNEEYTIAGLNSSNNCPFIYRKASLIAVCGKGGDASTNGAGGSGGGIGVAGANGNGRGGGSGGAVIAVGQLPSSGIFGSASTLIPITPDTKAPGESGGRTLPCPKGNYWISQGKSPCSDVGTTKIYLSNGTIVSNSASITRGFKTGYDIRQTSGKGRGGTTPAPVYNQQTCSRRVQTYDNANCPIWGFYCNGGVKGMSNNERVNYCNLFNLYCPGYRDESFDCSYYTYPATPAAGGNGGAGATGGNGGTDSAGGGGGSGYTDGSVTVVSTQQGGSTGFSKIIIRAV